MLSGINPLLTGTLLAHLDAMGHSDGVAVVDAHFPAHRVASRVVELPGVTAPAVVEAIVSVLPLDDVDPLVLMDSGTGFTQVQSELVVAAGLAEPAATAVERQAFYDLTADAYLVVRTGEVRTFGNALLRKGIVAPTV